MTMSDTSLSYIDRLSYKAQKYTMFFCLYPVIALLTLLSLGCDQINPTNPYDPEASADLKTPGSIQGRVVLPESFSADLLNQIQIDLRELSALDEVFMEGALDQRGRFIFNDLVEGRYQLRIDLSGFNPVRYSAILGIGELIDFGEIPLETRIDPNTGDVSVGVIGFARRALSPEGENGGILIEALETPFSTTTNSEGQFYLPLPPAQHILRFSSEYYQSARIFEVVISPDRITELEEVVVLNPNPSQVRGSVSLEGLVNGAPISSVIIRLLQNADDSVMDSLQTTTLDSLGRFIFDEVPIQPLWINVSCAGYYEQTRPLVTQVGLVSEAGHFDLRAVPVQEAPTEAPLRGQALFSDRDSHEGMLVEVRKNGVLVASVGTEVNGEYALNLRIDDYTLTFSSAFYISQSLEIVWDDEDLRFEVEGAPLSGRDPIVLEAELSARLEGDLYSPLPLIERGPWPEVSTLTLTGERGVFEVSADESGHFSFETLHPGLYGLEVNARGHLPATRIFDLSPGGLILEETINLIPLPPEVPAEIRGQALLAQGRAEEGNLAGEHSGVIIIARRITDDGVPSVDVAGSAVSNAAGEYRITASRQDYQLSFTRDGYVPRVIRVFWSAPNLRFEVIDEEAQQVPLDVFSVLLGQNLGAEGDVDLDGVANGDDNCPNLFNPPGIFGQPQDDLDGDGTGDPCDLDQDGDGLTESEELYAHLDPRDADTDDDLLGDGLEVTLLFTHGTSIDSDHDGRLDSDEYMPSTPTTTTPLDLSSLDLDDDGVVSLDEVITVGIMPADYDGDGIIDALESILNDQDGDGAKDQFDGPGALGDLDGDGFSNGRRDLLGVCVDPISCDPCPATADQLDVDEDGVVIPLDTDRDGLGDVCDADDDNDGELDITDVCRVTPDPQQIDTDLDGRGDACDLDDDNDGLSDQDELTLGTLIASRDTDQDGVDDGDGVRQLDNCPTDPNPEQRDHDQDQIGDVCDVDDDQDGLVDVNDNCPFHINPAQINGDGDGFGDACDLDDDNDGVLDEGDNCPTLPNPDQADNDLDGHGNLCDFDDDNDGVLDLEDNCVLIFNPDQRSTQGEGLGDACSLDVDGDGVVDGVDNCLETSNSDQSDIDLDGFGDVCDVDPDGDTLDTPDDNCPFVFNPPTLTPSPEDEEILILAQVDFDFDGIGDACDDDDDDDGVSDEVDSCPVDANEGNDTDRDQIDNACDVCPEVFDPLQRDLDGDETGDACDDDLDNDEIIDTLDNCPTRYNLEQIDLDQDGVGDACQRRFRNYLTDRDVRDLALYDDEVWVASESGGFTRWTWFDGPSQYERRRYTTSEGAPSNHVRHLAMDQDGNLLAITAQGLVTHFKASDTWSIEASMEAPESCRDGQPVIPWGAAVDLDIYRPDNTQYTAFRGVVVRTRGGQITCWKRGDELPNLPINGVDVNPYNGDVWVSTDGGAYRYNQQTGWLGFTRPILRSDRVKQVGFSPDGRVWVLSKDETSSYVILSGPNGEQSQSQSGQPSPEVMASITESRFGVTSPSGATWFFDESIPGLSAIASGNIPDGSIDFHPLLLSNTSAPLPEGPSGQLLHQGYQLTLVPFAGAEPPEPIPGPEDTEFIPIGESAFVDYVGPASGATRSRINSIQGMWSAHSFGLQFDDTLYIEEDGIPSRRVRDVALDALDQVWVATAKGLANRRLGRFYSYYPGGVEGSDFYDADANLAYTVEVDRENRAWFGTEAGVFYFNGVRIQEVKDLGATSLPPTYDFYVDDLGTLWVATASGLYRRRARLSDEIALGEPPFEFEHISFIPGFEPTLTRLTGSADGRIYGASPRGLFVRSPDGHVHQYTSKDGLPATRVHDIFVINTLPDPMIWLSTDSGLTSYIAPLRELELDEGSSIIAQPYPPFSVDEYGIMWISFEGGYFEAAPSDSSASPIFLFPFEMSRSEITQSQWANLTEGIQPPPQQAHLPQNAIDPDAIEGALPSNLHLPLQSEWELTAQGDRLEHHALYPWTESFPWYEGPQCDRVNSAQCQRGLRAVCENALGQSSQGLCDLGGNIAEWVSSSTDWSLVGGSSLSSEIELRLTERVFISDTDAVLRVPQAMRGFRLVRKSD